ncbi:hypothetical protein ACET3Z_023395 [Daucus carota]
MSSSQQEQSSQSHNKKRRIILSNTTVKLGCYSCRKSSKKFLFFFSKTIHFNLQKLKINPTSRTSSSASSHFHTPVLSFSPAPSRPLQGFGRIGSDSLAVEKDSDDPYLDFRRSMLQMILEKEIYSKDDLKELLGCFLHLNSPYHHEIIVRAFTDIWNGLYSSYR